MAVTVFELMARLGLDTSDFEKGLNNAKSIGSSFGSGLATAAKVGMAAVGAATTAMVGFGAASVKTGMQFDQSMSQVLATMGDKVNEVVKEGEYAGMKSSEALRDFAQKMGRTTRYTASESADALNYMALAGYDATKSMEMLPNVMNLASAGAFDLAKASDMLTDTETAFGISTERTTQMVDEMAKAASTGNTSVEQLGEAFLRVGGLARELNGGMVTLSDGTKSSVDGVQELEIAFTAMANAGVKGSEAGTHMRNMLLKLSDPTKDGVAQLEALGVAVFDDAGNMRALHDIMGDLSNSFKELTQEEKIQAISDLFNTRDMASAEALLASVEGTIVKIGDEVYSMDTAYQKFGDDIYDSSKGFEIVQSSWDSIGESILNAKGAADEMAHTQLDNLAGDVIIFKSALEGAQVAISDVLTPSLREFVQFGTEGVQKITDAFTNGGLSGAMEAFGEVLSKGLGMLVENLPGAVDAGIQLLSALGQGIIDNAPQLFNSIMQIGDIISNAFMGLLDNVDVSLQNVDWVGLAGKIAEFMRSGLSDASQFISTASSIISSLVSGIGQALPELIPAAMDIISNLANDLAEQIPTLMESAADLLIGLVEGLTEPNALNNIIDSAINIIMALVDGLIKALPKLIEAAPVIIANLVEALVKAIPKLIVAAVEIIMALQKGIMDNLPKIAESAIKIIGELSSGIIKLKNNLFKAAVEIIEKFRDGIKKFDPAEWGKDMIESLVRGIKNAIGKVKEAVGEVANTIKEYLHFSEPDVGPLSNFHTYAPDMMKLFAEGVRDNTRLVTDQIQKSFDFSDVIADQNVNVSGQRGEVVINVYGAEGQDEMKIAEAVSDILVHQKYVAGAVYA